MSDDAGVIISTTAHCGVVHLALAGELDAVTVGQLSAAIEQALHADQVREVVVDLADVTFLGCAAAAALLTGANAAHAQGISFRLVNARAGAQRLLTLAAELTASTR